MFNLGFRPFFLGAAIFAVLSIAGWVAVYTAHSVVQINGILPSQWHSHEMLYGYGMAVVAGFLLTAVKNWTGVQTPHGKPLLALFVLWAVARVLLMFGTSLLLWAALADLLFGLLLAVAVLITPPLALIFLGKAALHDEPAYVVRAKAWHDRVLVRACGKPMLAAMDDVVRETGATHAQVALAWLRVQPGIGAPIASATSVAQVKELCGAASLVLSADQLARLGSAV